MDLNGSMCVNCSVCVNGSTCVIGSGLLRNEKLTVLG